MSKSIGGKTLPMKEVPALAQEFLTVPSPALFQLHITLILKAGLTKALFISNF
jgi:hypothetical protein